MAIKIRRGAYSGYDASQLLQGEMALVTSGDPSTTDGIGLYIASSDGTAKQIAFSDQVEDAADSATAAATDAQTAAAQAQTYAQQAMSGTPAGYATVASNATALANLFGNMGGDIDNIAFDVSLIDNVPALTLYVTMMDNSMFQFTVQEADHFILYQRYDSGGSLVAEFQIAMG